jgi:hypothetical protein
LQLGSELDTQLRKLIGQAYPILKMKADVDPNQNNQPSYSSMVLLGHENICFTAAMWALVEFVAY